MASFVNLLPKVILTQSVSLEEAKNLRKKGKDPKCASEDCGNPLIKSKHGGSAEFTEMGAISRINGMRSYFHDQCLPAIIWPGVQVSNSQQFQTSQTQTETNIVESEGGHWVEPQVSNSQQFQTSQAQTETNIVEPEEIRWVEPQVSNSQQFQTQTQTPQLSICKQESFNFEPESIHKVSLIRQVVNGTANTIYRHPLITALAITALVAGLAYTFATAETLQTVCYRDAANSAMAWCADVAKQDDLTASIFVKYQGIRDWVPSSDLSTRMFESIKNGSQFVYRTFTKYFSRTLFG